MLKIKETASSGSGGGALAKKLSALRGSVTVPKSVQFLLWQVAYAGIGLALSMARVFGEYSPFGLAFAAAAPANMCIAAAFGSAAGYILSGSGAASLRYLATLVVVLILSRAAAQFLKKASARTSGSMVASFSCAATGLSLLIAQGFTPARVTLVLAESALAGGCAYFFVRALELGKKGKALGHLDAQDLACLIIFLCLILMSLSALSVKGIAPARMAAVFLILLAARYGGVAGGAVAGVCAGVALGIGLPETGGYLIAGYALGGLLAGVFSPLKQLGCAAAFVISNAVVAVAVNATAPDVAMLIEAAVASTVFVAIPARFLSKSERLFTPSLETAAAEEDAGLRRSLVLRLKNASHAMADVSTCVDEVCKGLNRLCAPDMTGVYANVSEKVCANCIMKSYCWNTDFNDTMNVFNDISTALRTGEKPSRATAPEHFLKRCIKTDELLDRFHMEYQNYLERLSAEDAVKHMRAAAADQFGSIAQMLSDLSEEYDEARTYDEKASFRVQARLTARKIPATGVDCILDKYGHMRVQITCKPVKGLDKSALAAEVGEVVKRQFDMPCVSTLDGATLITLSERARFTARAGGAQLTCSHSAVSGDSYECFHDGRGREILVISDGMGTGGRAAVDGAMACGLLSRLIKSGFSFDCSLQVVNSSLLVKSSDESLATLDIACIDLFTGQVDFLKAGAPASFIRRSGKAYKLENASLPAGILREVAFAKNSALLKKDDIVLLLSDGAVTGSTEWILAELETWRSGNSRELADHIAKEAQRRSPSLHDDDITVVAAILGNGTE